MGNLDYNPLGLLAMRRAPRCVAHSKRTKLPCKAPAVRGWNVCRAHGARGGAPRGILNGNYKHGGRTREAMAATKLTKACHNFMASI